MKSIRLILLSVIALCGLCRAAAQTPADTTGWMKGVFENKDLGIRLVLNLYEPVVEVPGLSFIGATNGYLSGRGVYGTWIIVEHERSNKPKAVLRLTADTGADSQSVEIGFLSDSTLSYRALGTNYIKKAQGRKLIKTESVFTMRRLPNSK